MDTKLYLSSRYKILWKANICLENGVLYKRKTSHILELVALDAFNCAASSVKKGSVYMEGGRP